MTTINAHGVPQDALINGCIAGDNRMQRLLYDLFAPKMYGVCQRYSANSEDAQDILQEAFIKVYRNLGSYRKEGSFEGWVRRIFVNTAIEHYRKKVYHDDFGKTQEQLAEDETIGILNKLAVKDIIGLVQQLSPGYRTIFNLYVIEGYSHKEISDMLFINEGTSKSQLSRAKAILQQKVKEHFDIA